jgi:predicted signal transduction protein with EAL and GGDEF domain
LAKVTVAWMIALSSASWLNPFYSCLYYLKHMPVDALKIDRSFIARFGEDRGTAIVSGTIALEITEGESADLPAEDGRRQLGV